ncbi:hypothetical protein COV16_06825 [Candidatus Woesearchaeota archaeon CG10_big_fil_rev_8_21_14_0_10_34_8]|nr:MAG: hypothetical protein COV16_06825 [Candidatus Woesearchaeota archaeon CG10_big_fil_rev_8_21_14_0_10_34_8]
MPEIIYPCPEKIIEYNLLALKLIKVKKSDQAKVLSKARILDIVYDCEDKKGDIYDKSVCLLKGIIQKHPFASGNRRTAFLVTKDFLILNKKKFQVKNDSSYAKVMLGIRENFYSDKEIKEWIEYGKIKEFRR